MKVIDELDGMELCVTAWGGAVDTAGKIIEADKCDEFEELLEEWYPDGVDRTAVNNVLWFEGEQVLAELGIDGGDGEDTDTDAEMEGGDE